MNPSSITVNLSHVACLPAALRSVEGFHAQERFRCCLPACAVAKSVMLGVGVMVPSPTCCACGNATGAFHQVMYGRQRFPPGPRPAPSSSLEHVAARRSVFSRAFPATW